MKKRCRAYKGFYMALIKRLILWLFIGYSKPIINKGKYPPILLFELGSRQVFHFPSPEELTRNLMPSEIYWQDTNTRRTYGPFPSLMVTMTHFTYVSAQLKAGPNAKGNVISVDFKNKKRNNPE